MQLFSAFSVRKGRFVVWKAKFRDGLVLENFDTLGRERVFGDIFKQSSSLESLSVVVGDKTYSVRMDDGFFSVVTTTGNNGFFVLDPETYNVNTLENIRPIYFVRETVNFTASIGQVGPTNTNFTALGFQATHKGKNIKRYLAIFPNGSFIVKDN